MAIAVDVHTFGDDASRAAERHSQRTKPLDRHRDGRCMGGVVGTHLTDERDRSTRYDRKEDFQTQQKH